MTIRSVKHEDIGEICRIYNYYVEHTTATFETQAVLEEEMKKRIEDIRNEGFPYYVLEEEGKVVGFAYIHLWHVRAAYSTTKEVTIYLDNQQKGKGYGTKLYEYLLQRIDRITTHALLAVIALPNEGSVKLHERFGFRQASHLKEVGYKFDQWQDVGHWLLIL